MTTPEPRVPGVQQHGYRGRVRSGCLTCRSRKVKCDEVRPTCDNCTRVKRTCVYKPRKSQLRSSTSSSHGNATSDGPVHVSEAGGSREASSASQTYPSPLSEGQNNGVAETSLLDDAAGFSSGTVKYSFLSPDNAITGITARLEMALRRQNAMSVTAGDTESDAASTSTLISRNIELTTTMDILEVHGVSLESSFSFFVQTVDCPSITVYDDVNWRLMKLDVVELGMSNAAVASAIIALSQLYKGQLYSLPLSKAVSLYHSSKGVYEKLMYDESRDFSTILAVTFLLCLFEFVHYETSPILREPSALFLKRLESWVQHEQPHSPLSLRIIAWMRLLHAATIRGGGTGLISDSVCSLFPGCNAALPNLRSPPNHHSDASTHLYQMLSTPIFEFYFQLQIISGDIAKLTHYHRSRTTGVDQQEVVQQMAHIKSRLHALWESRSTTQCQIPDDLRSQLAPKIANPIVTLIGVCTAAYHAEFVEMGRVLGDPLSEWTDSKQAMRRIREIIDGDWNAYDGDRLNAGYLRPLFLYAIECMDGNQTQWAVERLEQIKNPICRSDFFAAFTKALTDEQLQKERRVTTKYFCLRYFGVSPPFL